MALELRSQMCTFGKSTNCNEISFDPHSFFRIAKRSIEGKRNKVISVAELLGSVARNLGLKISNFRACVRSFCSII